jgi:hypothetical protein
MPCPPGAGFGKIMVALKAFAGERGLGHPLTILQSHLAPGVSVDNLKAIVSFLNALLQGCSDHAQRLAFAYAPAAHDLRCGALPPLQQVGWVGVPRRVDLVDQGIVVRLENRMRQADPQLQMQLKALFRQLDADLHQALACW